MKKIMLALTLLLLAVTTQAQDLSSVVLSMPDDLVLKLEPEQRYVLLDQSADTSAVVVKNLLGDDITRQAISNDYFAIRTSDVGLLQLKLLPLINNSYIIGVVKTVCDRACDSQIDFYTTSWEHLSQADLFPSKDKDWFIKTDADRNSQEFKNAYAALDMTPIKLIFYPDSQTLEAVYDIEKYLSEDDYKLLDPFLIKEPKVFTWDKTSSSFK